MLVDVMGIGVACFREYLLFDFPEVLDLDVVCVLGWWGVYLFCFGAVFCVWGC